MVSFFFSRQGEESNFGFRSKTERDAHSAHASVDVKSHFPDSVKPGAIPLCVNVSQFPRGEKRDNDLPSVRVS